uniref:J domain-containing protein n=1 Tax=Caenorhabditis japonica TaxID=281687 RepID=A0A8R1EHG9_CAEJA
MAPREDSPYTTLGISSTSDDLEIKKAYRKLALKWHPDKHTDDKSKEEAEQKFKKIAQAYEILTDKKKRADLDRSENPGLHRRRSTPGFRMHSHDLFRSPFDIFREFCQDPFNNGFFDDPFPFPDVDSYAFKNGPRSADFHTKHNYHRFPPSRVHIFYDDVKKERDDKNSFSTVIRFSSPTEPGKNATVRKTSTSTKVVDGKKIVTKTVENGDEHIVEVHEDGELKCRTVSTPPASPAVVVSAT